MAHMGVCAILVCDRLLGLRVGCERTHSVKGLCNIPCKACMHNLDI